MPLPRKKKAVEPKDTPVKGVVDHVVKQGNRNNTLVKGEVRVGISKGCTLNMGNYQSARMDFWMERVVEDSEHAINNAYADMGEELGSLIDEQVNELGIDLK
jgi:hypothetical protein